MPAIRTETTAFDCLPLMSANHAEKTFEETLINQLHHSRASRGSTPSLQSTATDGGRSFAGSEAAHMLADAQHEEAKQLEKLNQRLERYVGKLRSLENDNYRLRAELDALRTQRNTEVTRAKQVYELRQHEHAQRIADYQQECSTLNSEIARLKQEICSLETRHNNKEREVEEKRQQMNSMQSRISALETENDQHRRRVPELQDEIQRLQNDRAAWMSEIQTARRDAENIPNYERQINDLKEQIKSINATHDQEINELQNLIANQPAVQNTDAFRRELTDAVQQIRNEFNRLSAEHRAETDRMNKMKLEQIQQQNQQQIQAMSERIRVSQMEMDTLHRLVDETQNENAQLRSENQQLKLQLSDQLRGKEDELIARQNTISQLESENSAMMQQLQEMMNAKQSLDVEIAVYRNILDLEDKHATNTAEDVAQRNEATNVRPQNVPLEKYSTQEHGRVEHSVENRQRLSSNV